MTLCTCSSASLIDPFARSCKHRWCTQVRAFAGPQLHRQVPCSRFRQLVPATLNIHDAATKLIQPGPNPASAIPSSASICAHSTMLDAGTSQAEGSCTPDHPVAFHKQRVPSATPLWPTGCKHDCKNIRCRFARHWFCPLGHTCAFSGTCETDLKYDVLDIV